MWGSHNFNTLPNHSAPLIAEPGLNQELNLSPQISMLHHHTAKFTFRFIYKLNAGTPSPFSFTFQRLNDQSECPCIGASK